MRLLAILLVPALFTAGALPARAPGHVANDIVEAGGVPAALNIGMDRVDGLATIFADVAVDEEFIERNGTEWRDVLDLALGSANSVLKEVGVRIEMVSVSAWESDDEQTHMSRILDGVLAVTPRGTGRLLLAVTCQDSDRFDGIARDSEAAVVVRYNHDNWRYTGSLIAHEIAHLLGAAHHPEDEECESDGCVMEPAGYADVTEWCDDHREDIRAYLARAA